jgi:hypothetical protein
MADDDSGVVQRWVRQHPRWTAVLGLVCTALVFLAAAIGGAWVSRAREARQAEEAHRAAGEPSPPEPYLPPRSYICTRASGPIQIDGRLDEDAWKAAPWSDPFVDIKDSVAIDIHRRLTPTVARPRFPTHVKMLWDDRYFYIGADLREPHVWATLTQHDSYIFRENNDFEVFIDPDGDNHNYAELEINALNTTWDLRLPKPYRDGGEAEDAWEIVGLKTAVHVEGTLNDPSDVDHGWTIEIAIPWHAMAKLSDQPVPPRDGDQWRVNFSRVQWQHEIVGGKYRQIAGRKEDNWVWSPQGVVDMHRPERWGYVQFSIEAPGKAVCRPDAAGPTKHLLHHVYYLQKAFREKHDRYAESMRELGLLMSTVVIEGDGDHFTAMAELRLADGRRQRWHIREDSRVWKEDPE